MSGSDPLVWLPFDPAELGELPEGLRYERVDPVRDELPASKDEVRFLVPNYQLGGRIGPFLAQLPALEVVQTQTAGVDDVRPHVPEGVTLCNGRGIHDASTAELAVTLTLSVLRGIPGFTRDQDRAEWNHGWRRSLADRRVMILGYGSIGAAVEARLTPFECEVVRVARSAREGVHAFTELPDLLSDVDVVVVIVPLTDETRGLVDADFLGRLPDDALVVNVARGPVIDTDALLAELHAERLHAALDVFDTEPLPSDHPLWTAPNVLMTPHVGGTSSAMQPRAYALIRAQLARFAAGEPLENVMTGAY
ncbi:2-hydroxyacid dehydrogenase [Nocardioides sp. CFH 31398]|uniref:2-hydroxyacid dehydrogenase n=1 Tax=Nocardioides sp. CFH 31398 TaxID=2919579 RepID=UPI001F066C56|nr:2-hydroxyacid dehydrogenase [Nocardioides sp. CFH 31398]MCH1868469.1 2-hydroxyacid dehydrogenase [Nocardioides sp. CFH 31398]